MRALRFLGWFAGSLMVPGLGLWRAGQRGSAVVASSVTVAFPTLAAIAAGVWPRLAMLVLIAAIVSTLVLAVTAVIGALRASKEVREGWPATLVFGLVVFGATIPARVWRERSAEIYRVQSAAMSPSLEEGDQVIVRRGAPVTRGAVVTFPHEGLMIDRILSQGSIPRRGCRERATRARG